MIKEHLILKNDLKEIEKVRFVIDELFNKGTIDEGMSIKLNLVVEEMFTNIVNYAYSDKEFHQIDIIIEFGGGIFSTTLIDDGKEFNPLQHKVQDLNAPVEQRQLGGLGIHLMKNIMDEYEYKRENDKNILIIKKNIIGD